MDGLHRIGQVAIPVSDVERSIAFYRDVLGMRFLFAAPPGLGFFDCGGVRLMLDAPAFAAGARAGGVVYFAVDDLDDAFATLSARGAAFEARPHLVATMADHELWMAFLRDPDGSLLGLMAEVRG